MNKEMVNIDHNKIYKYFEMRQMQRQKAEENDHYVHGFMIYQCEQCGAVYIMWLEKGLEECELTGDNKPVPFYILCPECFGHAKDVCYYPRSSIFRDKYCLLKKGQNFFFNDPEKDCGVPIIFKKDYDFLTKENLLSIVGIAFDIDETMTIEEPKIKSFDDLIEYGNRKIRRHPEYLYNDTRYKRPKKGQKFFN